MNLAHEEAFQNNLVELGVCSSRQEAVQLEQENLRYTTFVALTRVNSAILKLSRDVEARGSQLRRGNLSTDVSTIIIAVSLNCKGRDRIIDKCSSSELSNWISLHET